VSGEADYQSDSDATEVDVGVPISYVPNTPLAFDFLSRSISGRTIRSHVHGHYPAES
jgi:hypothetical protein